MYVYNDACIEFIGTKMHNNSHAYSDLLFHLGRDAVGVSMRQWQGQYYVSKFGYHIDAKIVKIIHNYLFYSRIFCIFVN